MTNDNSANDLPRRTILLTYPGLLARYDQMTLLASLREKVGRKDGIPGLWLLIPGDTQPLLDGKAIPIISPGQRTRIPETWIRNEHRANGGNSTFAASKTSKFEVTTRGAGIS